MNTTALRATLSWLILVALTLISALLGQDMSSSVWLVIAVMLIIMIKGQQIVDVFMGLRFAPKRWRALLLSYVILMPTIIGIIYSI